MTEAGAKENKPPSALLLFLAVAWPYYLNDFYLIPLTRMPWAIYVLWVLDVVFFTAIPCLTLYILYRRGRLEHVRAALKIPRRLPLLALGAAVLALVTHALDVRTLPWFFAHGSARLCYGYALPPGPLFVPLLLYASISAGVMEEIIFRAHLMTLLQWRLKNRMAVIILAAAALFAAEHWCGGTGKLASTFLLGLIPVLWYAFTGNIWAAMIWHSLHDFFGFVMR